MGETRWVSQSEAADLETQAGRPVSQSRVSRFLADNPDVPVQRSPNGMVRFVDYEALAAARCASLSVQDKLADRDVPQPVKGSDPPPKMDATGRKRLADAERAELDLAERKSELLSRDAAAQAIETAGARLLQNLERRRRELAISIAGNPDARAVELELKTSDRALLTAFVADLVKAGGDLVATVSASAPA